MLKLLEALTRRSRAFSTTLSFALVVLIGLLDYVLGYELSSSIFYLIPVAIATWAGGKYTGILVSAVAAVAWFLADVLSGHPYSHPSFPYWNAGVRFGFFLVVTYLLSELRNTLAHEKETSRIDFRTGVANSRLFAEMARVELRRSARYKYPLTVAYIDLDNFKAVNDRFGHSEGDKLLRSVGQTLRNHIRATDLVARLGGDEFAILLPETTDGSAPPLLGKLQSHLLETMQEHQWPVTFSIGAVTFLTAPASVDEMVAKADALMYEAKNAGKSEVVHKVMQ